MAVGDARVVWSSVSANATLDVNPGGSDTEMVVFAFQGEAEFEVWKTDGTNAKKIVPAGLSGNPSLITQLNLVATTSIYYQLKNVSGASAYLGYDARVTK